MEPQNPPTVLDMGAFKEKRANAVWQCKCGEEQNQKFFLYRDGRIQCAGCDGFHDDICWGTRSANGG